MGDPAMETKERGAGEKWRKSYCAPDALAGRVATIAAMAKLDRFETQSK
jgi:hypothetical protein